MSQTKASAAVGLANTVCAAGKSQGTTYATGTAMVFDTSNGSNCQNL